MSRCALCPNVHKCLPPDGPESDILFVGDYPSKQEDEKGRAFLGREGEEINNHYLPLAGLRRSGSQFVTAIGCLPDTNGHKLDATKQPHLDLLHACADHRVRPLIERRHPPKLLVALGTFAARVLAPGLDLERQHGYPTTSEWGIPVFPMFSPALGMYEPKKMLYIRNDWIRLGLYLRNQLRIPRDEYPNPDYREITSLRELDNYYDPDALAACDTEFTKTKDPYCFTFSQEPGTGRLIRASHTALLNAFARRASHGKGVFLFHNWLADAPITAAMGLSVLHRRVIDTMVEVFHLGNLPQGLKALAWRELGIEMEDFEDVVGPYSTRKVLRYYQMANCLVWPKPEPQLIRGDDQKWKSYTPQSLNTKLKTFFTNYRKNPNKDVFDAWGNWKMHHEEIEAELGEWPGFCITHAPFERILPYACRDVDALLRLWPILERMRRNVRKREQQDWRAV